MLVITLLFRTQFDQLYSRSDAAFASADHILDLESSSVQRANKNNIKAESDEEGNDKVVDQLPQVIYNVSNR